jgi:hypothetical protein
LTALAQDKTNCPPGSWFCAEAGVQVLPQAPAQPAPAPRVAPQVVVEEEPPAPQAPPRVVVRRPAPPAAPPPVVVYQPVPAAPPPRVIIVMPGYGYGYGPPPVRPVAPPPPVRQAPPPRWHSEFGVNLRVEGVALGHPNGAAFNAGLGGVGLSLRYRPTPHFAFDLGVDLLAGNDYNGFERTEIPVSLGGILYLNPRSRVQFYLEGGAHFSRAQVRSDQPSQLLHPVDGGQYGETYTYFGGQGGGGFEFRLSRRLALNLDSVGFFRKRVGEMQAPEFIEVKNGVATGRTSNTSAGALIRGGLTFWW